MSNKKKDKVSEKPQTVEEISEESIQKLIDDTRTKSEAYKKILKSLSINKNRD